MTNTPEATGAPTVYRPLTGWLVVGGVVVVMIVLLGDVLVRAGIGDTLLVAPWMLLGVWIAYEITLASSVRVDDRGVRLRNMLRIVEFGWARVREIDMQWQLVFELTDGTKATALGGATRARPSRTTARGRVHTPASSRQLAEIRARWEAAPSDADAPIRRSWDWVSLILLIVILALAAASVVIAL